MPTTNELVIETLNRLLSVCKSSEQAFRLAGQTVKDAESGTLFRQYAHQRARLASELRMEIRLLGGEPELLDGMIVPNSLPRVIAAAAQDDEAAVVVECQQMQAEAARAFQAALDDSNIPVELLTRMRRQCAQVLDASDRMDQLEKPTGLPMPSLAGVPSATGNHALPRKREALYEAG